MHAQKRLKNVTTNQLFILKWSSSQSELVKCPRILRKFQQWQPKSLQAARKYTTSPELLQVKNSQNKLNLRVLQNITVTLDFHNEIHFQPAVK